MDRIPISPISPASSAPAGSRARSASTASSAFTRRSWRRRMACSRPTEAEVAHARRVVEAYDTAASSGRGAVSLDGKMIDEANVRMARVVLNQVEAAT